MATNNDLKNQLAKKQTGTSAVVGNTVKNLLAGPAIQKRFQEVLNQRAPQYMSSIVNLVNGDTNLQKCEPLSVISSAMVAATLDLPIDKNLGYAYVVPYGAKANFILGYKGYIQLALRTGQYKAINVVDVHEGELVSWNPLSEEVEIDFEQKKSDAVIGYAGYFKLINGFEKTVYWSKEQIDAHRKKFSKSAFGWNKDFDAMARKTVIRSMLGKWGILSIEMQTAQLADDNAIKDEILRNNSNEEEFNLAANIDEVIEVDHEVAE